MAVVFFQPNAEALDRRVWAAVLLKSALTSGTIIPFAGISTSNFYLGGFTNFSSRSSGNYPDDVGSGRQGYGGLIGYKLSKFNVEASARNLHYTDSVLVTDDQGSTENVSVANDTLVYAIGVRQELFFGLNAKIGYAFHEIQGVAQNLEEGLDDPSFEKEDNGIYLGLGFRIPIGTTFKLYADGTYYDFKNLNYKVVDGEVGLLYGF
jgi:hypothetical protein